MMTGDTQASVCLTEGQILQIVGEASMCWVPTPSGRFDTLQAIGIAKRALRGQIQDSLKQGGDHGGES